MHSSPAPARLLHRGEVLADPLVRELLSLRLVGVLATLGRGGVPHLTPLWVADGGDAILMATAKRSRKVANLRGDDRASLVLHHSGPGFEVCGASIHGRVEIVEGARVAPLVERVHRRYVEPAAERLPAVAEFLASDDVALRLVPERAWTWDQRRTAAADELRAAGGALPLTRP